jgi:hypothetical protein
VRRAVEEVEEAVGGVEEINEINEINEADTNVDGKNRPERMLAAGQPGKRLVRGANAYKENLPVSTGAHLRRLSPLVTRARRKSLRPSSAPV